MSAIRKIDVPPIPTEHSNQPETTTLGGARKKKLLMRRLTTFFICIGVVSFLIVSTLISQSSTLKEKRAEMADLDKQMVALEKQEVELNDQIAKLNDEEYLAKLARKDLLLSKDGEIIFNIPDDKNTKKSDDGK